ncbi:acetolactate synthase, partial [Lamprobacter modestohalophilus]
MRAAELFVRCLENEGVEYIFGIPGEENLDLMDALIDSPIHFITVRHEQGAAFMADVYGRLTGRPGVCLGTLGPGATNLITGVADANLDRAPVVAIAGQGSTHRLHKESHQIVDLVNLFAPISKYATSVREPEVIPEVVRKAFKEATLEKPGASFIELPENIAAAEVAELAPLRVQNPRTPWPPEDRLAEVAALIAQAERPMVLAGNGVIRAQ